MKYSFQSVDIYNLDIAAQIHALSWQCAHQAICSDEFIRAHTPQRQREYIHRKMECGKKFYLLVADRPKGIVSVYGNLIENLYVAPEEQHKGYGTALLRYAESLCTGNPVLWILSSNTVARNFYQKCGYIFTGNRIELKNSLYELEMTHIIQ